MKNQNESSSVGKAILTGAGIAILIVLMIAVSVVLAVGFGYLLGTLIVLLPFVGDLLVDGLPVTESQIPGITAWLAVAGLFIGGSSKVSASNE